MRVAIVLASFTLDRPNLLQDFNKVGAERVCMQIVRELEVDALPIGRELIRHGLKSVSGCIVLPAPNLREHTGNHVGDDEDRSVDITGGESLLSTLLRCL